MAGLVKKVGQFRIVNTLNDTSSRPVPPPTTAKRTNETPFSRTAKRPRKNSDDIHEVVSLDGSSELLETPGSAHSGSQKRRDGHESRSLRSSGERHGSEVNEFRATSKLAGIGRSKGRHRHKKGPGQSPTALMDRERIAANSQQKNSAPAFMKSRALLSQQRGISEEQISDNDEETDVALATTKPRQHKGNGRGTAQYTQTAFQVANGSSDDELGQPQSATESRDTVTAGGNVRRGDLASSSMKRPASSPDELQILQTSKKRLESSRRGDLKMKKSHPSNQSHASSAELTVKRAACEPNYIYSDADDIRSDVLGATNKSCSLIVSTSDNPKHFEVVSNQQAERLDELQWITPDLSQVKSISYNSISPIVRVQKSADSMSALRTGGKLCIEFGSPDEANAYIRLCREHNPGIRPENIYNTRLPQLMDRMIEQIKQSNENRNTAMPHAQDIRPLAQQDTPQNKTVQSDDDSTRLGGEHAKVKTLRAQMRASDDGYGKSPTMAGQPSQGRTPRTPKEVRQLQDAVGSDDDVDNGQSRFRGSSPSRRERPKRNEVASGRALRSTKPVQRTPSPVPERWTEKNPNWVEDRNYKIPLIYERTTISHVDILRLDEGQFLNDDVIGFYANYLHKQLEARDERMAKKVYVFNSFFWEKLRAKGHSGVKSWTSKIDLLSFDYLVVPINQDAHWFLAIVCNPKALLPQADQDSSEDSRSVVEQDEPVDKSDLDSTEVKSAAGTPVTKSGAVESQVDKLGTSDLEDTTVPSTNKKPRAKKGPGPRKYDPKSARVITLDSLQGSHTAVATALKNYLKNEIKEKKGLDIDLPLSFGMTARGIPTQTNYTDCGVYLLAYLEEFMRNPPVFTRKILQHEGTDWDVDAPALRNKIRNLIFDLQADYQAEQIRVRREKRRLADEKKSKSRTRKADASSSSLPNQRSEPHTPRAATPAKERLLDTPKQDVGRHESSPSVDPAPSSRSLRHADFKLPGRKEEKVNINSAPKSSQSQTGEHDDLNVSTIVNPSDSVEMNDGHASDGNEVTPREIQSMQARDNSQHARISPPVPTKPVSTTRQAEASRSSSSKSPSQKRFLSPIGPSSSSLDGAAATGSDQSPSRQKEASAKPDKHDTALGRFSRLFRSPLISPSAKFSESTARSNSIPKFSGVDSDSDADKARKSKASPSTQDERRSGRQRPNHTIDLTGD